MLQFGLTTTYNGLDNIIDAHISNSTINIANSIDSSVNVIAEDAGTASASSADYRTQLQTGTTNNKAIADKLDVDTNGSSYTNGVNTENAKDDRDKNSTALDLTNTDKSGSIIVTGAMSVAGSGKVSVGAALNIDDISNEFTANITGSNISADTVSAQANADTLLVGVAGGVAASDKYGAMGTVTWQNIKNDVTSTIADSTLTAKQVDTKAENSALAVNVGGQVSAASKVALGAVLTYNSLDNTTGAYFKGNTLNAQDPTTGVILNVDALGDGNIYAIGTNVAASGNVALAGTVAVNMGRNNVEAIVDKSDKKDSNLNDLSALNVNAKDDNDLMTIVLGVSGSSSTAGGAGLAYTDIGGAGTNSNSAKQKVAAQVNNSKIALLNDASKVNVSAKDTATIINASVGVAGSGNTAVSGSAATSLINKTVEATLNNSDINKNENSSKKGNVTLTATNEADIYSTAVVVAGSSSTAIGAGVAVNRINQNTQAQLVGGELQVANLNVDAFGAPSIMAFGFGGSGSGSTALAGSFGVNMIDNDVTAGISDSKVAASGNIGVVAQSDEVISNYAGALAASGSAAAGMTTSVNTITGDTYAGVINSTISAQGDKASEVQTKSYIADDAINNGVVNKESLFGDLKAERKQSADSTVTGLTGLVIDSSATHNVRSVIVAGAGSGSAAGSGAVNVNTVSGSTKAELSGGSVNKDAQNSDVTVKAADYTNANGLVGSAAGSMYAAVGAASDTNLLNRTTEANVSNINTLNADAFNVNATAKQGISSLGGGFALAIEGASGAGVVSVAKLDGTTSARVSGVTANTNSTDVLAEHYGSVHVGNVAAAGTAVGAAIGLTIGVTDDNNTVETTVVNSTIKANNKGSGINVKAKNHTVLGTEMASVAVAGLGGSVAGMIGVNNIDNTVTTTVSNSKLQTEGESNNVEGQEEKYYSNINVGSENVLYTESYGGSIGAGAFAGAGASVVVNTFDSKVKTNVNDDSTLSVAKAGNINITADDTKTSKQVVVNAAVGLAALSANVMITNMGEAITGTDDNSQLAKTAIGLANDKQTGYQDGALGLSDSEKASLENSSKVQASSGSGKGNVAVNVEKATVTTAEGIVNLAATAQEDVAMHGGSAAVGGASFNASVGILNVNNSASVNATEANITGTEVNLLSTLKNKTNGNSLSLYQGTAGGWALGAAYGEVDVSGSSNVNAKDTNITAVGNVNLGATDTISSEVNAYGLTAGGIAAGAIVATANNSSKVETTIESTEAKTIASQYGDVNLEATKANTVSTNAVGGAVGIVSGVGIKADASDSGEAVVNVKGNNYTLKGDSVNLKVDNSPEVKVRAGSSAAGMAAVQVSKATANVDAQATLNVAAQNIIQANNAIFTANVGNKNTNIADVQTVGVGISVEAGVGVNKSTVNSHTAVNVDVDELDYRGEAYTADNKDRNIEVTITGTNNVKQKVNTYGLTVGGLIAVGNNESEALSNNTITVKAKGGEVEKLLVKAAGYGENLALADGNGGGLAAISPTAGKAISTMNNNANVSVEGKWTVAETAEAYSKQTDKSNVHVDSMQVGGLSATGAQTESSITGASVVNIGGILQAANVKAQALNTVTTGDQYDFAVEGAAYGAAAANVVKSKETIDKAATVNILDNAQITTEASQTYEAGSEITANNSLQGKAAGAVAGAIVKSESVTTVNNTVNLGAKANLTSKEYAAANDVTAITLSSYDKLKLTNNAEANIPGGLGGYISSESNNTVTRNNKVNVAGTITSAGDINLYAGADAEGKNATLTMNTIAAAYNHTAIPIDKKPKVVNNINENNQVDVASGAVGTAVRNINATATSGRDNIRKQTTIYSWVNGGNDTDLSYVGNANGENEFGQKTNNFVNVNGSLTAGIKNNQSVNISGIVTPEDSVLAEGTNAGTHGGYVIEASDEAIKNAITSGSFDYGNSLVTRYDALTNLINAYAGKTPTGSDLAAYLGYVQDRNQLIEEMKTKGLYDNDSKAVIKEYKLNYVSIPDIVASGGSINVNSDSLVGGGKLQAQGAPKVTITNNSNAYLYVNDITIGDMGGEIIVNGTSIADGGNAKINSLNKVQDAAFGTLKTDDPTGATASIEVTNEYTGGTVKVKADKSYLESTFKPTDLEGLDWDAIKEYTPISTLEINGILDNALGKITVANNSTDGDIIIRGTTVLAEAGVNGKEVSITAKGTLTQGYTDSIVNIGGKPEYVYDEAAKIYEQKANLNTGENEEKTTTATETDFANAVEKFFTNISNAAQNNVNALESSWLLNTLIARNSAITQLKGTSKLYYAQEYIKYADKLSKNIFGQKVLKLAQSIVDSAATTITSETDTGSNNRIAGGSVYISASDINVNGTIQSGYANFIADIPVDALSDANIASYANKTDKVANVNGVTMYKINEGGKAVYNATTGAYDYVVQVYYNPETKGLVVEDISTSGGKIYLTGNISSTGNGKIIAMDGGADITIVNKTSADLNVGKVLNNDIQGLVSVTDIAKGTKTEYTKDSTTVTDLSNNKLISSGGASDSYATKENVRYNWTDGTETVTTKTYQNDIKAGLWGAVTTMNTTELDHYEQTTTPVATGNAHPTNKISGTYIGTVNGIDSDTYYKLIANNYVTNNTRGPIEHWTSKSGFLNWFHWNHYRWTVTTGSSQTYLNSLKADHNIGINFIGKENGSINLTGAGNVNLNGNIANNTALAALNVTATGGAITQASGTNIKGNVASLNAQSGIGGINLISMVCSSQPKL